jgi:hypothetical protein
MLIAVITLVTVRVVGALADKTRIGVEQGCSTTTSRQIITNMEWFSDKSSAQIVDGCDQHFRGLACTEGVGGTPTRSSDPPLLLP